MSEVTCPLCNKRISLIAMATGMCAFTIEGIMIHLKCAEDLSLEEIIKLLKRES